ncbi:helix-turn-helix domain-containing protein [Jiangella sp. DSM 45060]|uniref:helix-turn-helix domain-containing protein n=1 Tax=Jiangella sp. DSM 45060 TaxID=1798224 RepID=UPI00087B68A5|nr:helix-turn-helix domain-containing protein [Jiangella sp. DSM 45060]SDS65138.1 regulatory protein, luxR family [Jiangella sp. DSM 45060]
MTTDDDSSLAPVGLAPFDEEVYRALLTCVEATPAALAQQLGQPEGRVDRACGRLRALGLVIRMSGRRRRYTAVDPESALDALVRERAGELDQVRGSALALSSIFHAARREAGGGSTVELLNGPEEQGRWFVRLQHQVRSEMMVLDRPPYVLAAVNPVEPVRLDSGVHWRAIYAPEALEVPGAMDEIDDLTRRGEQGRVLPGLPMKLAIADRRVALLPLSMEVGHAQGLVIRESTLLDALVELFEVYWARATPLPSSPAAFDPDAPDEDRQLVRLLAAGLTDNAIARQLGLSTRTMRRRTRRLFDQLQATNRFQAGIQAARRGWW